MKLVRYGPSGREKPGLIDADGVLRDLSRKVKDIDGGSIANYFAFARKPIYAENPTRVVVAGRFGGDGELTKLVQGMARAGYGLLTVYSLVVSRAGVLFRRGRVDRAIEAATGTVLIALGVRLAAEQR